MDSINDRFAIDIRWTGFSWAFGFCPLCCLIVHVFRIAYTAPKIKIKTNNYTSNRYDLFFFHIKKLHYKSEKVNKKCVNMLAISMFKEKLNGFTLLARV